MSTVTEGRKAAKKPPLPLVEGVFMACPLSGYTEDGKIVRTHKPAIRICRGGRAVFICCNPHGFRGFITAPKIVKRCIDAQRDQASAR